VTRPQLSIVIPVYDNWWLTERCLRALEGLRGASAVAFETIVVDNASADETPRAIGGFPWVRYVRHETNLNFAGACNAGVRNAEAPIALLLNNDAYPLGDAFAPLVRAFDRPEVVIAGGALFFEDGVVQAAGLVLLSNAHWHYFQRNLAPDLQDVARPRDALAVSGAAMAVRSEWFIANGGFDESFVNGFEDVDLCLRGRAQGRAIAYVADARFARYEAASANRFAREAENERRFYARWTQAMRPLPRTLRGDLGAIAVNDDAASGPLVAAALCDAENALRAFGHPVVRGSIPSWRRVDRRFRRAANLSWFAKDPRRPGIAVRSRAPELPAIRTFGAADLEVPFLPCAAPERLTKLQLRASNDPACVTVGVVGSDDDVRAFDPVGEYPTVRLTSEMLLGGAAPELACAVHAGLSDECAFGNVLLALAGLPAVVPAVGLRALFAPDVAIYAEPAAAAEAVARLVRDPASRERYGRISAADARRRFSPRRSAIRLVDLLCAARFGLEASAARRLNR
jgi:GT2 family glycosyltransferase